MFDEMPAGTQYAETISARKRFVTADGSTATMSELVSEATECWSRDAPFVVLAPEIRARGAATLLSLGVPVDAPIITLHVREAGFNVRKATSMSFRDARIADYAPAIAWLTATGAYVIRLGDRTMTPAEPQERFIDYPFSDAKSDWMDAYLASRCRFHVGTSSGMSFLPLLFGRPTLFTNWITLAHAVCSTSTLLLPKVLLDAAGAIVPMLEYCGRHGHILERSDAELHGLSFRDNTPDELVAAVQLMDRYIDPETGRFMPPAGMFDDSQTVFEESELSNRPQIPPAFWNRYYDG